MNRQILEEVCPRLACVTRNVRWLPNTMSSTSDDLIEPCEKQPNYTQFQVPASYSKNGHCYSTCDQIFTRYNPCQNPNVCTSQGIRYAWVEEGIANTHPAK